MSCPTATKSMPCNALKFFCLLITLAAAIAATGCAGAPARGRAALDSGNLERAAAIADEARAFAPEDREATLFVIDAWSAVGRLEEAAILAENALDQHPGDTQLLRRLLELSARLGRGAVWIDTWFALAPSLRDDEARELLARSPHDELADGALAARLRAPASTELDPSLVERTLRWLSADRPSSEHQAELLAAATQLYAYRLLSEGRFAILESTLSLADELFDARRWTERVRAAAAIERLRTTLGRDRLMQLDTEALDAAAFEFSQRGLSRAASEAYDLLAGRFPEGGDRAARALREAGSSLYALGQTDEARARLRRSLQVAENPAIQLRPAYSVAERRGDRLFGIELLVQGAGALPCTDENVEAVRELTVFVVERLHESSQSPEELVDPLRALNNRIEACPSPAVTASYFGEQLADAGLHMLAAAMLRRAIALRPRDGESLGLLFLVGAAIDGTDHLEDEAAADHVTALREAGELDTPRSFEAVTDRLAGSRAPGVSDRRRVLLLEGVARWPADRDLVFALARALGSEPLDPRVAEAFDRYVASHPDPALAAWHTARFLADEGDSEAAERWLGRVASMPGSDRLAPPPDGDETLASAALLRLIVLDARESIGGGDVVELARRYVDETPREPTDAWDRVWRSGAGRLIEPPAVIALSHEAAADGYDSTEMTRELAIARLTLGERQAGVELLVDWVADDAGALDEALTILSARGAPADAVPLFSTYLERHGDSAAIRRRLGDLYIDLARDADRPERKRALTRWAYDAYVHAIALGPDDEAPSPERLRTAGFFDLAAARQRSSFSSTQTPSPRLARQVAFDLLRAGAPWTEAAPYLEHGLMDSDDEERAEVARWLTVQGFPERALPLARQLFNDTKTHFDPSLYVARAREVAQLLHELGDSAAIRHFAEEALVEPARLLSDPQQPLTGAMATWDEPNQVAAALFGLGSELAWSVGDWESAADSSAAALRLGLEPAGSLLDRALLAEREARGQPLRFDDVTRIVGLVSSTPEPWLRAGRLLAERGDNAAALGALRQAIELGACRHAAPPAAGAALNLGELDTARAAVERCEANERLSSTEKHALLEESAQVFADHGAWSDAIEIQERAVAVSPSESRSRLVLAELLFRRGDARRALREADLVLRDARRRRDVVELLFAEGFVADALEEWSDLEREAGTVDALDLYLQLADAVRDRLGARALHEAMRRLDERSGSMAMTSVLLAEVLIESGELREPARILSAHEERLHPSVRLTLASLFGMLGADDRRDATVRRLLADAEDASLETVAELYVQLDAIDDLMELLERLGATPQVHAFDARVLHASLLATRGEIRRAVTTLRGEIDALPQAGGSSSPLSLETWERIGSLARALERLTRMGHASEAAELADAIAADRSPVTALELARVRAALALDDSVRAGRLIDRLTDAGPDRVGTTAAVVEILTEAHRHAEALALLRRVGERVPRSSAALHFQSWLRTAFVAQNDAAIDEAVGWFFARAGRRPATLSVAADSLGQIYAWERQAELLDELAHRRPGDDSALRASMRAHARMGDAGRALQRLAEWTRRGDGGSDPDAIAATLGDGPDPEIAIGAWRLAASLAPTRTSTQVDLGLALATHGRRGEGVEQLRHALGHASWEASETARALTELAAAEAWAPCRDLLVAALDGGVATDGGISRAARCALALDDRDTATRALERADLYARDDYAAAVGEAEIWLERGERHRAMVALERAAQAEPDAAHLPLLRGWAELLAGDTRSATIQFQQLLPAGAALRTTVPRAAALLADAGAEDDARRLGEAFLAEVPARLGFYNFSAARTLGAALLETDPQLALEILRRNRPSIVALPELSAASAVLASLFEGAGEPRFAAHVYRRHLAWAGNAPILMNNLAYVYAVNDFELVEGTHLARLALANDPEPNANTLDTLAWVEFRLGELERARDHLLETLRIMGEELDGAALHESAGVVREHLDEVEAALAERPRAPSAHPDRATAP